MMLSRWTIPLAILATIAGLGLPAASATAVGSDTPTTTTFAGEKSQTVPFGADWVFEVRVDANVDYDGLHVDPNDGTIDIIVSGQPDDFATDLPLYPGGLSYFSQPDTQPLLAPGKYTITAIFTPSVSGDYASSKTKTTASLTITELTLSPTVEVITDAAIVTEPTVRTAFSGTFLETTGAPPAGTWTVTATDESGATAFERTVEQPTQSADGPVGPLDIPISGELEPGETYTVNAVFTPATYLAAGLTFDNVEAQTFTTAPPTVAEILSEPLALPLWALVSIGGLLVAALVLVIVLALRRPRRARVIEPDVATTGEAAPPEVNAAISASE